MTETLCRRCLLRDLAEANMDEVVHFYERLSPQYRVSQAEYEARLTRCRQCSYLQTGTCMQCGCYVEVRAAQQKTKCPLRYW